jgi:hypothetical protein
MNKEQAIAANKAKGQTVKQLRSQLGVDEFNSRFTGDYKGHIKKLKSMFANTKFGLKNFDQNHPTIWKLTRK